MKVIKNFSGNYEEDPVRFLDFENYTKELNEGVEFYFGHPPSKQIFNKSNNFKILFTLEEQYSNDPQWHDPLNIQQYVDHVDIVLTIIPTNLHNLKKRKYVFFPFNDKMIPPKIEKKYDVSYTGFAKIGFLKNWFEVLQKYNLAYVSFKEDLNFSKVIKNPKKYIPKILYPGKYDYPNNLITHPNLTYEQKLNTIAESKVSITHNLLHHGTPQLKSRMFESAFCRSLILVYKDSYNLVNDWFEESKHFVFFENNDDLKEKLDYILNNYKKYDKVREAAFHHAKDNYTVEKFVNKYLEEYKK